MTLPDFQILHRNCYCAIGHVPDRLFANDDCRACEEPFGFNIPIVRDEGRLTVHLSCAIAEGVA